MAPMRAWSHRKGNNYCGLSTCWSSACRLATLPFFYRRSEYPNPEGLSRRMERDIETFMPDSLDFFQTFDDMELYPGIVDKAIRLGYGLITNHPFIDGNKRIGTHALLVTLDINGIELQYQDEDLIQLILKIASGKADDCVLRTWVLAHIA